MSQWAELVNTRAYQTIAKQYWEVFTAAQNGDKSAATKKRQYEATLKTFFPQGYDEEFSLNTTPNSLTLKIPKKLQGNRDKISMTNVGVERIHLLMFYSSHEYKKLFRGRYQLRFPTKEEMEHVASGNGIFQFQSTPLAPGPEFMQLTTESAYGLRPLHCGAPKKYLSSTDGKDFYIGTWTPEGIGQKSIGNLREIGRFYAPDVGARFVLAPTSK